MTDVLAIFGTAHTTTYNVGLLDCNEMIFQALEQLYGKIGKKLKGEKVLHFNYSHRKGWFFKTVIQLPELPALIFYFLLFKNFARRLMMMIRKLPRMNFSL